jgi:pimeloyl-ACP methyl ester carboxylesterase
MSGEKMSILDTAEVKAGLANDAAFNKSLRFLTGDILLKAEKANYLLEIKDGAFVDFREVDDSCKADFTFIGSAEDWRKVLQKDPPPGCQSPMYNDGRSGIRYEGDPLTGVGWLSPVAHELTRVMRTVVNKLPPSEVLPEVDRDFDAAVGRYVYLRIEGIQYRVYFEEAGEGKIPLLLQHTAGSDSRQARHFLEDPDFQKHFRMIAYDLPYHGRSLPPMSTRWWEKPYVLTKSFLIDFILELSRKLKLDRPVFMGSAMGGMLALDLAYYHPDDFRAVIGLNAGPPADFDPAMVKRLEAMGDPRMPQFNTSMMRAAMASSSPEIYRRELEWVYGQSAPGVGEGALNYFVFDHDLTPEQAATIDMDKVAVYLFTGQDDFFGGEAGTCKLVENWPGVPFKMLRRLGHFGIAEDPKALKADIWPAIEEIIATRSEPASVKAAVAV